MPTNRRFNVLVLFVLLALLVPRLSRAEEEDGADQDDIPDETVQNVDYTKLKETPGTSQWAFGPTGFYGWTVKGVKQIYVKAVDEGSPAAGVLQPGDVVLGVVSPKGSSDSGAGSKNLFSNPDVRLEIAAAITEAEKTENGGRLVLNVWRKGKTFEAKMTLRVMGSYSATAPVKSPKTDRIIELACQSIVKRGLKNSIAGCMDALGLMSTGRQEYFPLVRDLAHKIDKPGNSPWGMGYTNLFLTEYYLATKDAQVLPTIKECSEKMALGQGLDGLWSHGLTAPIQTPNGPTNGIMVAYGAMNSCSLPCGISLVLAQKCGVNSKMIDNAVKRFTHQMIFYADKGAVPYGDHPPAFKHESNGKTAMAAVYFNLLGDEHAAGFFARMTTASYLVCEGGHTGNFFSFTWGALGAGVAGDEAAAAYMEKLRWYHELERRWDGGMFYQGTMNDRKGDPGKYTNWSQTGARLIQYSMENKALYITGKGGRCVQPIVGEELAALIADGRWTHKSEGLTGNTAELLKMLGSWSPVIREFAAKALSAKGESVVPQLLAMLQGPDRNARYGACTGLKYCGQSNEQAAGLLMHNILKSDDPSLRYFSAYAFTGRGMANFKKQVGVPLLEYATQLEPTDKMLPPLGEVLFKSIYPRGKGMEGVDRNVLIPAIKAFLRSSNGGCRSCVGGIYPQLSDADLNLLWGDIYLATRDRSPSNIMFQDGVRFSGLRLMAKHGVKEGIDVGLDFISEHRWGSWKRVLDGVPALLNYGAAIKDRLAEIKSAIDARYKQDTEESKTLYELIDKFEREKHPEPKTISIASAIKDAEEANAHFSWDAAFQKVVASMTPQEPSATRKPATPTTQAQSQAQAATPKVASEAPAGVIAPEALARWRERFIKKLDASAKGGNRLKLNVSGKDYVVVSASEANLMVSMQGSQLPMPWAWVTPKSRLSLANGMVTDDDVEALLIAAVFNLEMGQNDQAETLFARATLKDREAVKSAREQLTP